MSIEVDGYTVGDLIEVLQQLDPDGIMIMADNALIRGVFPTMQGVVLTDELPNEESEYDYD